VAKNVASSWRKDGCRRNLGKKSVFDGLDTRAERLDGVARQDRHAFGGYNRAAVDAFVDVVNGRSGLCDACGEDRELGSFSLTAALPTPRTQTASGDLTDIEASLAHAKFLPPLCWRDAPPR
jgi:hypothetical protein